MKTAITQRFNQLVRISGILGILLTILALMPGTGFSQSSNRPVSNAVNDQIVPAMTTDGNGGTIIAWQDKVNGKYEIFAQRMNASGVAMWTSNGIPICVADSSYNPIIVSDDNGGAIISWQSYRGSETADIYAQKVNSSGQIQWELNGVPVCEVVFEQDTISMISDGFGGAILTWQDYRSNNGLADIYAQRIGADGSMIWTPNGVSVCNQAAEQGGPKLVSDGFGGAFITWHDNRAGNFDIYTQRITAIGGASWTTNGAATCTMATDQLKPDVCSDGADGIIVVWYDFRSTTDYNIYAQRQGPAGGIVWVVDGIVMNNNVAYDQIDPKIVSDGMSGAIISWTDYRTSITSDIYAQRVNTTGAVQWTATGVIICTEEGDQVNSQLVSDGNSGAYITWEDHRNKGNSDIYAQRIASDASITWAATGYPIEISGNDQARPRIVSNGDMGAVVVWQDFRNGDDFDIYAAGFNTSGIIAATPVLLSPADDTTGLPLSVILDWDDVSGSESYSLQVSTDSSFGKILIDASGLNLSTYELGKGLNYGTTYFWRASSSNAGGSSEFSAPFSFRTISEEPSVPELVSPTDGSTGQPLALDLDWNDATNASTYNLQVSTDSSFTGSIINVTELDSSGYSIASGTLSNLTTYYWRVSSTNKAGSSEFSDAYMFTTIVASPGVPVLASPLNGATGQSLTATLNWDDVQNSKGYQVQVSFDSSFAKPIIDESNVTISQYAVQSGVLTNGTWYFWRVKSDNFGGSSEFSSAFTFRTILSSPIVPALVLPLNGASNVSVTPFLDWEPVASAETYNLFLSTDSSFADTVLHVSSIDSTEYNVAMTLNESTTYYWKVSAQNKGGEGDYSEAFSFTTISPAPQAPVLLLPENGQINTSLNPFLDWNDIGRLESIYELEVALDTAFTQLVTSKSGITSSEYLFTDTLAENTAHYWRVRAHSQSGSSPWSETWIFTTTFLTGLSNTGGIIPKEFSLHQNYPNPFNPTTKIKFDIPQTTRGVQNAQVMIYNMLGQTVATLFQGQVSPGVFELQWDASKMSSGIYFYELRTNDFRSIKRMTLLK